MKKFLFLTLFVLSIGVHAQNGEKEVYFPILDGKMTLRGILSQPENAQPDAPLLILVSPPQAINADYSGFFKALSDSLNSCGIVTFRYDNRNFSDTIDTKPNDGRYTMHDGADDLHDALTFLKSQNRPIGLVGHSEGGSISIIETARNADVKYLLLLATAGVSGELFSYTQSVSRLDFFDRLPSSSQEIKLLKYDFYHSFHILANNSDNEIAFSKLRAEARRFYKENKNRKFNDKFYFGKQSEDEYVEKTINKWAKNKRGLAFIRYNPADYFPMIKCPIFIAYAKDDNLMRYRENQESLERILMENRNFDYKSIAIDSVTHSFEDSGGKYEPLMPLFVHKERKNQGYMPGNGFSKLCKQMVGWIRNEED